ncbi:MAG: NYN domain-containing protein [Azoarcus sp.]|nr:NYN domain-containing protein [Azoarcus sp.]
MTITHTDLKPQIQQKGVDMRIGLDIAALTLKKHAQIVVLVSGDSDFIPAMKFARREGCQLFLCTLGRRVKPAMLEHSDLLLDVEI